MGYITESFKDLAQRNNRWQELKRVHQHVVRYSESVLVDGKGEDVYFVAFPSDVVPMAQAQE